MTEMERDMINPDHLRQDEMEYKIYVGKGQALPHRKVGDLQKILREVGREPVDLQYLQLLDFEGELRTIDAKICDFFFKPSQIAALMPIFPLLSTRELRPAFGI
jgi:hypothetical protein